MNGLFALFFKFRVVTVVSPVAAFNSVFCFQLALAHACLQTVVNARRISNNQGRAIVSLCFGNGFKVWFLSAPMANLRYINIAVAHGHHAEVIFCGCVCRWPQTLAIAAAGVALEDWPPVLEYTSVSNTITLMFSPLARTWSSPP